MISIATQTRTIKLGRITRNALAERKQVMQHLRTGVWIYLILLLAEGALRKWVLPGLATPLLVVRDPLAVWLLLKAWRHEELPMNWYFKVVIAVTLFCMFTTLTIGHGNMLITFFGARIFIVHFPMLFLIGRFFNMEDVLKIGRFFLWTSLPMIVLVGVQFYSPQSAFINRGVGGDLQGAGFAGAMGYFRPPGVFSFTTGNTQYWTIVEAFVVYFWFNSKHVPRYLLWASTAAVIASIPLSISRTLLFQTVLTLAFVTVPILKKPKYLFRMMGAVIGLFLITLALNKVDVFNQATAALTTRVEDAGESEGGLEGTIGSRFFGGMVNSLTKSEQPFFGYGLGIGTNVGTRLMTGRVDAFLIGEQEWDRLIGEMGLLIGMIVIFARSHLAIKLFIASYQKLSEDELLPWILISVGFVMILQGAWGQPTTLGFSTLLGGLCIASLKSKKISVLDFTYF